MKTAPNARLRRVASILRARSLRPTLHARPAIDQKLFDLVVCFSNITAFDHLSRDDSNHPIGIQDAEPAGPMIAGFSRRRCNRASARSISRWIRRKAWSLITSSLRKSNYSLAFLFPTPRAPNPRSHERTIAARFLRRTFTAQLLDTVEVL